MDTNKNNNTAIWVIVVIIVIVVLGYLFYQNNASTPSSPTSPTSSTTGETLGTSGTSSEITSTSTASGNDPVNTLTPGIASALKVAESEVSILSIEPMDWPNACLGLSKRGEVCAEVVTPGYKVTAVIKGKQVNLRSNKDGSIVRQEL